jgi:hypothetical protein
VAALREKLGHEHRERAHLQRRMSHEAEATQRQLQQAEAAASQIAQKLDEATPAFGLTVEGVWFRRWRALAWRGVKLQQQRALRQAQLLRSTLQKVREEEADAKQRGEELQAEVDHGSHSARSTQHARSPTDAHPVPHSSHCATPVPCVCTCCYQVDTLRARCAELQTDLQRNEVARNEQQEALRHGSHTLHTHLPDERRALFSLTRAIT